MSSPIEYLPVELLIEILIESQIPNISEDVSPFEIVIEEYQRPITNWIPLMLVCRRFRDVILEASNLWSRLPVSNNLIALRHRLLRSQDSLLELLFSSSWESALPLILPHASRIRAIITTPRFHIDSLPSLVHLLDVSLPALEHLYVVPEINLECGLEEWLKLIDVGSVLNEVSHPRVKTVTSPHLLLPPKESDFWSQKLSHLDIRSQHGYITLERRDDILAILRSTPGLESLAITFPKHALPSDYLAQMSGEPPVSFSIHPPRPPAPLLRLRGLTLDGPAWLCGPVLHDIDTPLLERFYCQTSADPRPDTGDTIASMFPERLCRILARYTRLRIQAAPFATHGFGIRDCRCEEGQVSSDMLCLRILDDNELGSASEVLCRVFKAARLEALEVNYFERQGWDLYDVWKPVLETFPGLRRVFLYWNDHDSGHAMVNAIEALQREGLNPEMVLVAEHAAW